MLIVSRQTGTPESVMMFAVDLAAWAQAFVAVGTLVLALATYSMARHTRRTADAAFAAAKTAAEQLRQAAATQVDARSALVVPVALEPSWPPYVEDPRRTLPSAQYEEGHAFVMPAHASRELWFRVHVLVRNEGPVSALLWGLADGRFVQWATAPVDAMPGGAAEQTRFIVPPHVGGGRYLLPAGRDAVLEFVLSDRVQSWVSAIENAAPSPPKQVRNLIIGDQFDDGAVDNVTVVLQGAVLRPNPDHKGEWRLAERGTNDTIPPVAAVVEPVRRRRFRSRLENRTL